jgi:hypothetical protein
MDEESKRTGANPALNGVLPAPPGGEGGGGVCKPQKRIRAVQSGNPRKRGGQPGNRNAVKTGWNTAEVRALRSVIWQHQRVTRAMVREARAFFAEQQNRQTP